MVKDMLEGGGGTGHPSVSWVGAPVGAALEGRIMPQYDETKGADCGYLSVPRRGMDGQILLWPDGTEKGQVQIIVHTDFRGGETLSGKFRMENPGFEDDGYRTLYISGKEELADLKRAASAAGGLKPGSYIRWTLTELKPNPQGSEPIKIRGIQLREPDAASLAAAAAYRAAKPRKAAPTDMMAAQQGGWGQVAPQPPAQGGWGAPAQQGPPPQQGGWGAPAQQGPPPQQGGWGAPAAQAPAANWGAPPQGPPPQQPPAQGGWGAPAQQGPPPQQGGWGAPAQQGPPPAVGGGWGPPPQQGPPPQAEGNWGPPPAQAQTPGAEPPF